MTESQASEPTATTAAPPEIFTDPWARGWGDALNANDTYRAAAVRWEGALVMELQGDTELGPPEDRAVWLDLWHGECREARTATAEDRETAPFVLSGPAATWKRILEGGLDPLYAVMAGKLKLTQGKVAQLVPYTGAAKEMVATARRIPATLPDAWKDS